MNKLSVFTKMLCVLLCLYATQSSLAQTKFWGVGAATGQADAQFSNPFVQSTTASNYSPTQWTALSVYDSDTMTPGNAYWVRNLTGVSQGGYAIGMGPANSPSAANGIALFDSDFMDNGGMQDSFGLGTSPGIHKGELISPRIDLTAAMDSAIMIRFYSYYRLYQIDDLSVSLSADDGLTWTNPESIMALQPTALHLTSLGWVRMSFPSFTTGVANLTQCRIKFTFEGYYYYAMIDDISVEMAPEYDIALSSTNSSGGDIVRIGGNIHNTIMNIDSIDLREWFFGATIFNRGDKDILPSAHPRLRLKIDFQHPVSGQMTYNVYTDTIIGITDTIKANDPNGVAFVDYLRDINFITDQWVGHGAGNYSVTYWVEQDSADGYADNDTIRSWFTINERSWWGGNAGYISKARLTGTDGKVYGPIAIFPSIAPITALENGSVFYFSSSIAIDSIIFRYATSTTFLGASTQTLLVKISRFVDGTNGGIADGLISTTELTPVMQAQAVLSGLVPNINHEVKVVSNFVDPISGAQVSSYLPGSGFYYVSVLNQPALFGGPATFRGDEVPLLKSDLLNYSMNAAMTSSTCPIVPAAFRVIDSSGVESWNTGVVNLNQVPAIGIYLYQPPLVGINAIATTESNNLTLYPNPTTNHLNIQTTFPEPTDVQYIITDITGKVYYIYNNKNNSEDIHTVDITALPAGVYLVSAKTEKGVSTEKFVKE